MPHNEIAQLTGRSKNNISRYAHVPITRIARSTLTELLEAFVLTNVSAILNVRLDLDNYSETGKPAPDAVRIESLMPVWKSVDWQHVVQQWHITTLDLPRPIQDLIHQTLQLPLLAHSD